MGVSLLFERLISYRPPHRRAQQNWEQLCLRDMVFDNYCRMFMDADKADAATKEYLDEIFKKLESMNG